MTSVNPTGNIGDLYKLLYTQTSEVDTNNDGKKDWRDLADSEYGNSDGNITMYEFTKMVHAIDLDHSIGDDIISQYFKKFDTNVSTDVIINDKGEKTNVRNKYALTTQESDEASKAIENYWNVSQELDKVRDAIFKDQAVTGIYSKFPTQVTTSVNEFLAPYIDNACEGKIKPEDINVEDMVAKFKETNGFKNLVLLDKADNVLRNTSLEEIKSKYSGQNNLEALLQANLESIIQNQLNLVAGGKFVSNGELQEDALRNSYLTAVENMIRNGVSGDDGSEDAELSIYCLDETDTDSEISKDKNITIRGLDNNNGSYTPVVLGDVIYANFDIGKENEDSHKYSYNITHSNGLNVICPDATSGECTIGVKQNATQNEWVTVSVLDSLGTEVAKRTYIIFVKDAKSTNNDYKDTTDYSDKLLDDPKLKDHRFSLAGLDIYGPLGNNVNINNYTFAEIYNSDSVVELYTNRRDCNKPGDDEAIAENKLSELASSIIDALSLAFADSGLDTDLLKQAGYNVINRYKSDFTVEKGNRNNDNIDHRNYDKYSEISFGTTIADKIRDNKKSGIQSGCNYKGGNHYTYDISFKLLVDDIIAEYNKLAGTNVKL
ncbi:MAG: hypothetical protein MJ231_00795 [bacterium]|nr:hypothetical protein [bacterium]